MSEVDLQNDGKITFDEFLAMMGVDEVTER
jgi:Ca2+-binding EF-hand superfamily protein